MSSDAESTNDGLTTQFNRLVKRAKAAIFVERLVPKVLPPLGVAGLFLTASWAGAWEALPPEGRLAGVVAFAAAFIASPFMSRTGSLKVTDEDGIRRLDGNVDDPSRPAQTLSDQIADKSDKIGSHLWDRKLKDVWDRFSGKLKVGGVRPGINKAVGILAIAAALGVGVTAPLAQGNHMGLIENAFVWQHPVPPLETRAWIIPPQNIDGAMQQVFDHTTTGTELLAHERSRMALYVFGENTVTVNGQTVTAADIVHPSAHAGDDAKSTYQYEFELAEGDNTISIDGGPSWTVDVSSDHNPTVILEHVRRNADEPNSLDVIFVPRDDHGIEDGNIVITNPDADPDAQVLPSGELPTIRIPNLKR